ncbi:MAG TPA: Hpt domain-containing protein [Rhizobacter sp.]|nr:Hpt domain-containing protein [Rhizobacter sp.]
MNERSAELKQRLDGLRRNFEAELGARVDEVTTAWRLSRTAQPTGPQMQLLQAQVHHLAGTSGIFGLHEVGRAAFRLEEALDRQSAQSQCGLTASERDAIDGLIEALQACAHQAEGGAQR